MARCQKGFAPKALSFVPCLARLTRLVRAAVLALARSSSRVVIGSHQYHASMASSSATRSSSGGGGGGSAQPGELYALDCHYAGRSLGIHSAGVSSSAAMLYLSDPFSSLQTTDPAVMMNHTDSTIVELQKRSHVFVPAAPQLHDERMALGSNQTSSGSSTAGMGFVPDATVVLANLTHIFHRGKAAHNADATFPLPVVCQAFHLRTTFKAHAQNVAADLKPTVRLCTSNSRSCTKTPPLELIYTYMANVCDMLSRRSLSLPRPLVRELLRGHVLERAPLRHFVRALAPFFSAAVFPPAMTAADADGQEASSNDTDAAMAAFERETESESDDGRMRAALASVLAVASFMVRSWRGCRRTFIIYTCTDSIRLRNASSSSSSSSSV